MEIINNMNKRSEFKNSFHQTAHLFFLNTFLIFDICIFNTFYDMNMIIYQYLYIFI